MPKPTIMEMLKFCEIQIVNSEMGGYSFTIPADEYPAITFTRDMNGTWCREYLPTFLMFGNGHTRRFRAVTEDDVRLEVRDHAESLTWGPDYVSFH